jgi:hypothetical protein
MSYRLLIDKRERDVLVHEAEFANINYEPKQMEIADYVIMKGDTIVAVIERKSWNDFAASIKDGRHHNKSKMTSLRHSTGCIVFYIVEGVLIADPNKQLGRIPYRVIESAMFHMQLRDNIHIIRTSNTLDTARVLVRLIASMGTLKDSVGVSVSIGANASASVGASESVGAGAIHAQGLVEGADEDGIPLALTQRVIKSTIDIVRVLWSGFRSITATSADYLIEQFSVADFVRGNIPKISDIKFSNGRLINKPMARSLSAITPQVEIRLLSLIPMISVATATGLLNTVRLKTLLSYSVDTLEMRTVNGKKIGRVKAQNIIKYFNYKKGVADDANVNGVDGADADANANVNGVDAVAEVADTVAVAEVDVVVDDANANVVADDANANVVAEVAPVIAPKPAPKPRVKPAVKPAVKKPARAKPAVKKPVAKKSAVNREVLRNAAENRYAKNYNDGACDAVPDDGTTGYDDE